MRASLDHVHIFATDLAATVAEVTRLTGTRPVPGGVHPGLGTRNFLLGLGEGAYVMCRHETNMGEPISGPKWVRYG